MGITYIDEEPAATTAPKITYEERRKPVQSGDRLKHASDSFLTNLPDIPNPVLEFATGGTGLLRGIANLPSKAGLGPPAGDAMFPPAGDPSSGWKTTGQVLDPIAWAIGGGVPAAAVKTLERMIALGPAAQRTAAAMAANWMGRATGRAVVGGATGGTIGALSDEGSADTGAAVGAAANVLLPPVITAGFKGAGKVVDIVRGRAGSVEASNIAREAAGADLPAVRSALAAAPDDITAAQATYGLNNDQLAALGALAQAHDKTSFFSKLAKEQRQELIDIIRRVAGGANQTEARSVAEASQGALNRLTTPMREDVLTQANIAGTTGTRLQSEAEALRQGASSKVGDVRRLGRAGEVAEDVANVSANLNRANPPELGIGPRIAAANSYGTELAKMADRIAKQPAADSLLLGQAARFKEMQLQSLADAGFKPLSGDAIMAQLRAKIADPKIGSETLKEKVLTNVLGRFEQWTKANGVIDASAAYGIRKSAVNDAIEQLMGSAEPASKAKAAAGLLREVKPIIDDALGRASGNPVGWGNYLKTFEEGMNVVNQQRMGAKFLELLERNPRRFIELAKGNEPRVVEKRFGSEYDVSKAMGDKMQPIERVAADLQRDIDLKAAGERGAGGLQDILKEHEKRFRFWNVLDPKVAMINRVLGEVETKINKGTFNKLMEAQQNPQKFLELLGTVPAYERMKVLEALTKRGVPIAGGIAGANQ